MVHQLRKSYSLTDLNSDEPDYGADLREITNDTGMSYDFLEYFQIFNGSLKNYFLIIQHQYSMI